MRQPYTIGTNTTPIFSKDKTTQKGRMLMESGCSPHCRIVSPHLDIQGWDSPVTSPPKTPGWDIPSYFTTTYQEERLRNNLPEAIPYQGPFGEEDPLPPHLAPNTPEWGAVSSSVSPNFQLINFLEVISQIAFHRRTDVGPTSAHPSVRRWLPTLGQRLFDHRANVGPTSASHR